MTDRIQDNEQPRTYRVTQLGPRRNATGELDVAGTQRNEAVTDFDSIVTHHPGDNRHAHLIDGVPVDTEEEQPNYRGGDRSYAYIGGEIQEIIDSVADTRVRSLKRDQVLLVKDFILDEPNPLRNTDSRAVDVPAPTAGYVSRVIPASGMVEIMDYQGGDVIARVRHMSSIQVDAGDTIVYGQALGTQNRLGLDPRAGKHVHLEMDTRHFQQYENYISDLVSGRLPVQAEHRQNVDALPIIDDGTFHIGEISQRVQDLQRLLVEEGIRGANNELVATDGVYRLSMQPAVWPSSGRMACPKQATSTQPLCNFRPLKEASGRAGHLSPDKRLILLITGAVWDPVGHRVEGRTHVILTTQTTS